MPSPTPVQRSMVAGNGSSLTLAAHGSGAVGDTQVLLYVCHASYTASTATPTGWTKLGAYTSAHSGLVIYTRTLDATNLAASVVKPSADYSRMEMRTYRSADTVSVLANGLGLSVPSRVVFGMLVRVWASAQDNSSNSGTKTLTPDPALANSTGAVSYEWYAGLAVGDEPMPSGSSAPGRTATISAQTVYPQWVDLQVASTADIPPGTASTIAMGDAATMEDNVGVYVPMDPRGNASMEANVGVNLPPDPRDTASLEENVGIERPTVVVQNIPQIGWGTPLRGPDSVELIPAMAKAVVYFDQNVVDAAP